MFRIQLTMLKKMGVEFTALFVGRMGPPSYRRYVEDMTGRLDLNVKFLGWIPYEELPYIYDAADVTVVPSYSEGDPLTIPESLACGTPVIATNVGGSLSILSRAGLRDNLIDIRKYDFHAELAEKLRFSLHRVDKSKMDNTKAPFWDGVAKRYLRISFEF